MMAIKLITLFAGPAPVYIMTPVEFDLALETIPPPQYGGVGKGVKT